MKRTKRTNEALSRRRFLALVAAGSAALVAPGAAAAPATPVRRPKRATVAATGLSQADRKELLRQQASTQATLDVIRKHAMPPGTELGLVFRPLAPRRGNG